MPEDRAKAVHDWLNQPASHFFIAWLSNQCAGHAAEAGNKMVEGSESDQADAKNIGEEARRYLAACEIMTECLAKDFRFQVCTFREKPLSTQ